QCPKTERTDPIEETLQCPNHTSRGTQTESRTLHPVKKSPYQHHRSPPSLTKILWSNPQIRTVETLLNELTSLLNSFWPSLDYKREREPRTPLDSHQQETL
ncbi:Hypothetical predicted protein, partial [Pelobates cultripes]